MSERRRFPVLGPRALEVALVVLGLGALVLAAGRGRAYDQLTEDEREYLYAATNLTQTHTLSFAPPGAIEPAPDAYREPGFPFLIAATWWTARLAAPASATEVEALFVRPPLYRSIRWLQLGLLAVAAAASGASAWQLGGRRAGAAAFLLVAASPALHERGVMIMTEVGAAAGLAVLAAALVAAVRGRVAGAMAATAILAVLPLLRAEALLLLPLAGLAAWWATPAASGEGRRGARPADRWRRALAALAVAALPSACWMARNDWALQGELGAASISDRSGLAFAVRASLDDEIARIGVLPALLAWTPLDSAQAKARALAPSSTLVDYRWSGQGNFFTRTIVDWRRERAAPDAAPLAIDARYRRSALHRFVAHPGAHLRATVAVGWRGLFAERSPAWLEPFDARFAFGVLHLAAVVLFAALAISRRESPQLAFLLPFATLYTLHALSTEFLPRYAVPLLPAAWVAVAVLLFARRPTEPERRVATN